MTRSQTIIAQMIAHHAANPPVVKVMHEAKPECTCWATSRNGCPVHYVKK